MVWRQKVYHGIPQQAMDTVKIKQTTT